MLTVGEILFKMESDLILNTLRHLTKGNIASAKWGIAKLSELGIVNKQNSKIIQEAQKDIIPIIRAELKEAQTTISNSLDKNLKDLSITKILPSGASPSLINTLTAFENKVIGDISATGSTMLKFLDREYEQAIKRVLQEKAITGESIRSSISKTANTFKKKGVSALIDKGGRSWSIEAYSQMVVRSNARQIATQTQFDRFDEYGVDLVEISSHLGARPNCEPYQGYIYSLSGKASDFPPFSSTSHGEIDGLFGINCGHRMYPYKRGTKKTFEPYPKKVNDKAYELSQKQRKLERNIRGSKRSLEIAKLDKGVDSLQNIRIAKERLKADRANIKTFIDETGRTARGDRVRIY